MEYKFCYYFLYFSISPRGFIRNMNVLFGDILLIFIPDREIRGVVLRPPPPPQKKKKFGPFRALGLSLV